MKLNDYFTPIRRWWWLIITATLLALISSYIVTTQQLPIYSARATVMIGSAIEKQNPNGNELILTQQLARTYADILMREPIQNATKAALSLDWLPEYTANVVLNTQLIEISVTDTDSARAQAVANELANQLMLQSPDNPQQETSRRQVFVSKQLNELEGKITETQQAILDQQESLGGLFSARQIADAQKQIDALQDKLRTLQSNYATLLSNTQNGALNSVSLIEAASLPTRPIGPNKQATILLAGVIGLILGTTASFLLNYLDDTLKTADDVAAILGLTTLSSVPEADRSKNTDELFTVTNRHSPVTEAYRVLRTNLQFVSVDRTIRSLMITSPAPAEGKSMTTANLAVTLAQSGKQVILVDTDLHRPRMHRVFRLQNNVGVTSALLEEAPMINLLLQDTEVPGLRVLTTGPLPPNPAELLGTNRMRELVSQLQNWADIVILDTPPMMLSDSAILASQMDAVMLVIDSKNTKRELARKAVNSLQKVQAKIIGVVLNRIPMSHTGYHYYQYRYYSRGATSSSGSSKNSTGNRSGHSRRTTDGRATRPTPPVPHVVNSTSITNES